MSLSPQTQANLLGAHIREWTPTRRLTIERRRLVTWPRAIAVGCLLYILTQAMRLWL